MKINYNNAVWNLGSGTNVTRTFTIDFSKEMNKSYTWKWFLKTEHQDVIASFVDMTAITTSSKTASVAEPQKMFWDSIFPENNDSSTLYFSVEVYKSNGALVNSISVPITCKLHERVIPTVGSIDLNAGNITINGASYDILLRGVNKFLIYIGRMRPNYTGATIPVEWAPTPGATIKSYTITGSGIAKKIINTSSGSTYASFSNVDSDLATGKNLSYTVIVEDSRGRRATRTVLYDSSRWFQYSPPVINSFSVTRTDAYGNESSAGTYANPTMLCTLSPINYNSTDINNRCTTTYYVNGVKTAINQYGVIPLGNTKSHYISAVITDAIGVTSSTASYTIKSANIIVNFREDGRAIAFGGLAKSSTDNRLDSLYYKNKVYSYWPIQSEGRIVSCGLSSAGDIVVGPVDSATKWPLTSEVTITTGGNITATGTIEQGSDERLKQNVSDLDADILHHLRPVQYELIKDKNKKVHYGFIAQEVATVFDDADIGADNVGIIGSVKVTDEQELYTLAYNEFIPLLVKKCQELQKENDNMKAEISEIKTMLSALSS